MSKSVASFGEASTKLPEAEGNYSDMDTNFSKRSRSTPYNKRSISGQAKQVQRAIEYKGVMSKEELDRLTHQQVIDLREAYRYKIDQFGCTTVLTKERLSQLGKKIDSVAEMFLFNAVKYITEAKKKQFRQMKSRRYTKSVFKMESANCATKVAMILRETHTRWCMNKSCATVSLVFGSSSGRLVGKGADARAKGR